MSKFSIQFISPDHFTQFIRYLPSPTQAKVLRVMNLLEKFGIEIGMPFTKKITKDIWELRITGKVQVRVLYTQRGQEITILHWFVKKNQKLPKHELDIARKRLTEI